MKTRHGGDILSRLPVEILLEILGYCQFPWTPDPYYFDPRRGIGVLHPVNYYRFTMQRVCRLWRHCVIDTPWFWSRLDADSHLTSDVFDLFLRRGAQVLLEVALTDTLPLVPSLHRHMHRIQRLAIDHTCVVDEEAAIANYTSLFTLPAPALHEFRLVLNPSLGIHNYRSPVVLPRLCDHTPSLTHLHLYRLLPWPANSFPGLTHLFLGFIPPSDDAASHDFTDFLEGSPRLEELVVLSCSICCQHSCRSEDRLALSTPGGLSGLR